MEEVPGGRSVADCLTTKLGPPRRLWLIVETIRSEWPRFRSGETSWLLLPYVVVMAVWIFCFQYRPRVTYTS